MTAYVIVHGHVTDAEKYEQYKAMTPSTLEQYGGRFIVRGGEREDLEGGWEVSRVVILEFPSMEAARTWYDSPEYRAAREVRAGAADVTFTLVEGV